MFYMFNKEMARSGSRHRLAKAPILSDLKQYQYVRESQTSVNRHVWYIVCTPRQKQIERQRDTTRPMGEYRHPSGVSQTYASGYGFDKT